MMGFKRTFIIVLDSLGIGELPDAYEFDDIGANTLRHIAEAVGELKIPNLEKLGLGNIIEIKGIKNVEQPLAYYSKAREVSKGKDTLTGHWEMMGIITEQPFITFTEKGFPVELINEIEKRTCRKVVGNKSASGTGIIEEYGEHHMKTGDLIIYTSADSVLQIAAHEEVIKPEELWDICNIVREITLRPEWKVGRVIARPFIGERAGLFSRTPNRHDYSLKPDSKTILNEMEDLGLDVIGIGKIKDIYGGEGLTKSISSKSNEDGMYHLMNILNVDFHGLAFLNLVDFDAKYGHRRDPLGYGRCLEAFDLQLGELLQGLKNDDLLIITADHGNDPTFKGTDHTREYVPVLIYSKSFTSQKQLKELKNFVSIGGIVADNFEVLVNVDYDQVLNDLI